jgi:hypothetical protein
MHPLHVGYAVESLLDGKRLLRHLGLPRNENHGTSHPRDQLRRAEKAALTRWKGTWALLPTTGGLSRTGDAEAVGGYGMSPDLQEELKAFERDLGSLVARFLRLYERLESEVRPAPATRPPPAASTPRLAPKEERALLPGYH